MTFSTSLLAYADCKQVLDQALQSKRGIRLEFKNVKNARYFVARCNAFRVLDRKENIKLYPETHTMCGKSAYDVLRISARENIIEIAPIALYEDLHIVDIDTDQLL
jgi:hypothetical protein